MRRRSARHIRGPRALLASALLLSLTATHAQTAAPSAPTATLAEARRALADKQFARAKDLYGNLLRAKPDSVDAQLGLADAELGLHQYEAAEWDYRRVVAAQPQLWIAHKNLVIIEAALGRWDEFERERAVLRAARERHAPGISARESDVIDTFEVTAHGTPQRWIVREYFEPVGRSQARYNLERFSPEGRVEEYISLEPTAAAQAALAPGDVRIGEAPEQAPPRTAPNTTPKAEFSLNWYTGKAHGTIARYPHGEPTYQRVRTDALRWLRRAPHPAK